MCPPPADIGAHWTDEEVFLSLERIKHGSALPSNVNADIIPYHYKPEHLPDGIWYLVNLEEEKDTEKGFWKAKGDPCQIFANSSIAGWRTTLEFYEGQAPHGCKTDWLMQEYMIIQKGPHENRNLKESSSLCRVFLLDGQSRNQGKQTLAKSNGGQSSTSRPQVNKENNGAGLLSVSERHQPHPAENVLESSYLSEGDYLELGDLESPSFSSENSSCLTISSDECFDSLALLQELDTDINQDLQQKNAVCKFSVSASHRPNEVVICPATSGSLDSGDRGKLVANGNAKTDCPLPDSASKGKILCKEVSALKTHEMDLKNEEPSSKSHVGEASSGSHKAATKGERNSDAGRNRKKSRKMKYLWCLSC